MNTFNRIICICLGMLAVFFFACVSDPDGGDNNQNDQIIPPAAPDSVWIDSASYSSFRIVWNSVDSVDGYHAIIVTGSMVPLDTVLTVDTFYTFDVINTINSYSVCVGSFRDTVKSIAMTDYVSITIYKFGNPLNVRLDSLTTTIATVSFQPTEDAFPINHFYRAYVRNYDGLILDSTDADSSARSITVSGLQKNTPYKISVVSATSLGPTGIDTNCLYDTSTSIYNTFRFPYVYANTYETPATPSDTAFTGVPGGIFLMGYMWEKDSVSLLEHGPLHEVIVSSFYLAKHEVTVLEYAEFLNAVLEHLNFHDRWLLMGSDTIGDTVKQNNWMLDYDGISFTVQTDKERCPMLGLYWYGAAAYCNWYSEWKGLNPCYDSLWQCDFSKNGCRLPTEAEFEYVTSTAADNHKTRFTWGFDWKTTEASVEKPAPEPVGSYTPFMGIYDLVGSAMEHVNDWSDVSSEMISVSAYYQECLDNGVIKDPTGPSTQVDGFAHMMRGGSFEPKQGMKTSLATYRYANPCHTLSDYGFRMAMKAD